MTTEKQQRDFLRQCAADSIPITYTDGAATLSVYAARLRFSSPCKRENVVEEMAELVLVEASGGLWSDAQADFLRACGDDTKPLLYTHTDGKQRPAILTRLSWATPHKGPRGDEPVVQLRLVESFAGRWMVYTEQASIADELVGIELSDPLSPNVYGSGTFGYGAYG